MAPLRVFFRRLCDYLIEATLEIGRGHIAFVPNELDTVPLLAQFRERERRE